MPDVEIIPGIDPDGRRVVIPSASPDYGPWRVEAVQPKGLRDAWRVLCGRYQPRLTLKRAHTLLGYAKKVNRAWDDAVRKELEKDVVLKFEVRSDA